MQNSRIRRTFIAVLFAATGTCAVSRTLPAQDVGGSGPAPRGGVVVEEETGDVHLARLLNVDGTVRDTADGITLGNARVELIAGSRVLTARSSEDGHFRLGTVPAGRYTVRVTRMGYEP